MTPFGEKVRELRDPRGVSLRRMAADLEVTPAYLSALEHGHRSPPNWALVQRIISYFDLIWDDADELEDLARNSHPRVVIDTAGLSPQATRLANRLSRKIHRLDEDALARMIDTLDSGIRTDRGKSGKGAPEQD